MKKSYKEQHSTTMQKKSEVAKLKKSAPQLEKPLTHHVITEDELLKKFQCLSGKFKESLNFSGDPLTLQKSLRNEWEKIGMNN